MTDIQLAAGWTPVTFTAQELTSMGTDSPDYLCQHTSPPNMDWVFQEQPGAGQKSWECFQGANDLLHILPDVECSIHATAACTLTIPDSETDDCAGKTKEECIMPTCFWYDQYIWNQDSPDAKCHGLTEMLTDNWFIPVGAGVLILVLLLRK